MKQGKVLEIVKVGTFTFWDGHFGEGFWCFLINKKGIIKKH